MKDDNFMGTHLIKKGEEIAEFFDVDANAVNFVTKIYPMLINPFYFSLIKKKGGPIWRQCVPNTKELKNNFSSGHTFRKEVLHYKTVIQRGYNRATLLVTNKCAVYCRFCSQKGKGIPNTDISWDDVDKGLDYIEKKKKIREVILSGGDPLMLQYDFLTHILKTLEKMNHVKLIRIETRIPVVFPMGIKDELISILKISKPVYIITQFNHPAEINISSRNAIKSFVKKGFPVFNQTVLLKGVNDNVAVLQHLFENLLEMRVKPLHLFISDLTEGISHFHVPVETAILIYKCLLRKMSCLALPRLSLNLPYGGGPMYILPPSVISTFGENFIIQNYEGYFFIYPK